MPEPETPRADALIMFGITGDLGRNKIIPALAELSVGRLLDDVQLIGVGRRQRADDDIAELVRSSLDSATDSTVSELTGRLRYVSGDASDVATFDEVAVQLDGSKHPVVYAAIPPSAFGDLARAIQASQLPDTTRVVVEKPFGFDGASARDLHATMSNAIGDNHLFIVDHFLAKAAVENLLTVRTANALFDQVLHRRAVESVHVEMRERDDVSGRGSFYEQVGVIDDVVQNHLTQLAALALMERPVDASDDAYHVARSSAIASMTIDDDSVVLGQYDGYVDHDDVDDDSTTPTYCSFTMRFDTERWRGVPIEVVGGKALDDATTAVTFHLVGPGANTIRFGIKPEPTITMDIEVLDVDSGHRGEAGHRRSEATLCGPGTHGNLGDYATLLDDALDARRRHFAQIDDVVLAWDLVAGLTADRSEVRPYPPGSVGPTAR